MRLADLWTRPLVLGLLAAASGLGPMTPSARAEDVVLQFWDNQQTESGLSEYQKQAVSRFEAANPGIKINVVTVPYPEYQQRLLTAVQGGNAPDVSTVDQIWQAAFADSGSIVKLDDRAESSNMLPRQFFKGAFDSAFYKNDLWGIPFNVDVWSFSYYNAKILKEAGVDPASIVTWDGLKAAAAKLTDPAKGRFAVGLFAHKGEDTVVVLDSFIYSNGGSVLDDTGKCTLTQPPAVKALEYLASLAPYAPKGILNASSGDMRELFLNGSLAIEFWPALEQPTLQKSKLDWDFVVGHAPAGMTPIGTFGGWNLVVYSSSKHQDAAWKFVEFLTRRDVNGAVVDLVPANIPAATDFLRANRRHPDAIFDHLQHARARPLSPRYLEVSDIQVTLAQDIFSGVSPAEAAKKACAAIDALR